MSGAISTVWAWLAPIAAGLLTLTGQLWLNQRFKRSDERREQDRAATDAKRSAEAEWRIEISSRIEDQDAKIGAILEAQCTQMRSDLVHKAHRYVDDLGCASMEEKDAFDAEYKNYCAICEQHGIQNNFVASLARQVMSLPNRP